MGSEPNDAISALRRLIEAAERAARYVDEEFIEEVYRLDRSIAAARALVERADQAGGEAGWFRKRFSRDNVVLCGLCSANIEGGGAHEGWCPVPQAPPSGGTTDDEES